ncbi:MAG: M48 family metallopeptidase [Burkholderiaceae bacterium]
MNAEWFDGKTTRAYPVFVSVNGDQVVIRGDNISQVYRAADITWPERTEAGSRILRLPDNSSLNAPAGTNWSDIARQAGVREHTIVKWQQSTRLALVALVLVVVSAIAGYVWGIPLIASSALALVPEAVDKKIGETFMSSFGPRIVGPTKLPVEKQQEIRDAFASMVDNAYATTFANGSSRTPPRYNLAFHDSKVGPNAFALPGGLIIMTDQLVELTDGNTDMVLGVLAHELGHVEQRHSMKMISQTLLIGTIVAVALGDYGDLVATIPLLLGQTAYSREFERAADTHSIEMLLSANKSPAVMAEFFRRLETSTRLGKTDEERPSSRQNPESTGDTDNSDHTFNAEPDEADKPLASLGLLLSSHPATEERIQRFTEAR